MRSKEQRVVMEFCLEHAEQVPVSKRVSLYLGLAEICGDLQEQKQLRQLAADLDAADHRCREFRFNFTNGGKS